jgi:hypothetical protein
MDTCSRIVETTIDMLYPSDFMQHLPSGIHSLTLFYYKVLYTRRHSYSSSTTTRSCSSRSITFPLSSSAITSRSGIWPGNLALQKLATNSGEACWCMSFTTSGLATALALGKRFRSAPMPKKWSPWLWVI